MRLFCLLCIPLLYILRRRPPARDPFRRAPRGLNPLGDNFSFNQDGPLFNDALSSLRWETLWALPLGALAAALRAAVDPLVPPGALGLSRWISGFIDVVGLPALAPLITCGALAALKIFPRDPDYADFALLWLVPQAALIAAVSPPPAAPLTLVVVPLLWAAQALGIPLLMSLMIRRPHPAVVFCATIGIAALPAAAVSAWWALFGQQTLEGVVMMAACMVVLAISVCASPGGSRSRVRGDYVSILDNHY